MSLLSLDVVLLAFAPPAACVATKLSAMQPLIESHSACIVAQSLPSRSTALLLALPDEPLDLVAQIARTGLTALGLTAALAATASITALALWIASQLEVSKLRARVSEAHPSGKSQGVEPSSRAFVHPRDAWAEEELRVYDGSSAADGPILLAADGLVFNVARARNLYGPDAEYSVMAGRDASTFLARNTIDPIQAAASGVELNLAERAALGAWAFTLKQKYDVVGRLMSADEASTMEEAAKRSAAYLNKLEALSMELEATEEAGRVEKAESLERLQ